MKIMKNLLVEVSRLCKQGDFAKIFDERRILGRKPLANLCTKLFSVSISDISRKRKYKSLLRFILRKMAFLNIDPTLLYLLAKFCFHLIYSRNKIIAYYIIVHIVHIGQRSSIFSKDLYFY